MVTLKIGSQDINIQSIHNDHSENVGTVDFTSFTCLPKRFFWIFWGQGLGSVGRDWHQRSGEERQIHPARRDNLVSNPGNRVSSCSDGPILARIFIALGAQRLVSAKSRILAPYNLYWRFVAKFSNLI